VPSFSLDQICRETSRDTLEAQPNGGPGSLVSRYARANV
jgi:hypothetical protein